MTTIYFATSNNNKFKEVKQILETLRPDISLIQCKIDILEIQGTSKQISEHKTQEVIKVLNSFYNFETISVFTEDISLYCKGLHGMPGPYIKDTLKNVGLQKLSDLVELSGNTKAEALATYTLYKNGELITISKSVIGNIVKPRGDSNFGFDSIFEVNGITFAEMDSNTKNTLSHRRKALEDLSKFL